MRGIFDPRKTIVYSESFLEKMVEMALAVYDCAKNEVLQDCGMKGTHIIS